MIKTILDSMAERDSWRALFTVLSVILLFVKVFYTCSSTNRRVETYNSYNSLTNNSSIDMSEVSMRNNAINKAMIERLSNDFLYKDYKSIDSLKDAGRLFYGVVKLKKDTVVAVDFSSNLKIYKDFYFQNNHDDSLRIAFKSPENLNVFIHDFDTKSSVIESFKSFKSRSGLISNLKVEKITPTSDLVYYKIEANKNKFNGFAFCVKNKDSQMFFEFESEKLSKDRLKIAAITFLSENLKADKK